MNTQSLSTLCINDFIISFCSILISSLFQLEKPHSPALLLAQQLGYAYYSSLNILHYFVNLSERPEPHCSLLLNGN